MTRILAGLTRRTKNSWKILAGFCGNRAWSITAAVLFAASSCAFGQVTLSLSSGSAVAGGTVSLDLSLNAAVGSQPASLEWTYSYPAVDFTSVRVVVGPAAVTAGKSISCNAGAGSYTCLLFGLNATTMANGVVATATFTVSPTTVSTSSTIQILNVSGATASSSALSVTATGGQVTISPPFSVSALACTPATVTTPGSASCTVTMSAPAPTGGLTVTTGTGGAASVTVPSSVTIAAGSKSAGFTLNASTVSASTTVMLVASLNGTSQNFALTLAPPPPLSPLPSLTGLTCSPTALASHASATCTVSLSAPAPSGGLSISIQLANQAPLSVPTSVTVSAGSSIAQFSVQAGKISSTQTATIVASLDGTSASFSLTLSASVSSKHYH